MPENPTETSVQSSPAQNLTRLSVNINGDTAEKLRWYKDHKHISITETVRRAIALLELVERETERGGELLLKSPDGKTVRQLWLV